MLLASVNKWLDHLEKIRLVLPAVKSYEKPTSIPNSCRSALIQPKNFFNPKSLRSSLANITSWCRESSNSLCPLFKASGTGEMSIPSSMHPFDHLSRTALLITFNSPFHRQIGLIQRLYEPHFQHVILCTDTTKSFETGNLSLSIEEFSYIQLKSGENAAGYFQYFCVLKAIEMNLNIDGLVVIGDDTLVNHWNAFDMQRFHLSISAKSQMWLDHDWGINKALIRTLNGLEEMRIGKDGQPPGSVSRFDSMVLQHWKKLISLFGKCSKKSTWVPISRLLGYHY